MQESEYTQDKTLVKQYKKIKRKKVGLELILLGVLFLLFVVDLMVGSSHLSFSEVILALIGKGTTSTRMIVYSIRLPRVLAGILAGIGLALSGLLMQTLLKNPMASPSTLGVSHGAVFGANFAIIVLGSGAISLSQGTTLVISNPYVTTLCAFLGSMISTVLILVFTKRRGFSSEAIVLSGIALGSLFQAGTTILQYFSDDTKLSSAVFWSFGDLGNVTYPELLFLLIGNLVSFLLFFFLRWRLNALESGGELAQSMGIKVEKIRFLGLFLASLLCSLSVSFLGIIGFVGLIAPHIARKLVGSNHEYLLGTSIILGAILLLFADVLSRSLLSSITLPIGAITTLFGAPLFLSLLFQKRRRKA
jgi:iron complex transport system permease protein